MFTHIHITHIFNWCFLKYYLRLKMLTGFLFNFYFNSQLKELEMLVIYTCHWEQSLTAYIWGYPNYFIGNKMFRNWSDVCEGRSKCFT